MSVLDRFVPTAWGAEVEGYEVRVTVGREGHSYDWRVWEIKTGRNRGCSAPTLIGAMDLAWAAAESLAASSPERIGRWTLSEREGCYGPRWVLDNASCEVSPCPGEGGWRWQHVWSHASNGGSDMTREQAMAEGERVADALAWLKR